MIQKSLNVNAQRFARVHVQCSATSMEEADVLTEGLIEDVILYIQKKSLSSGP